MPLKVREHDHGVVIDDMAAHGNFLEMLAAAHRQIHRASGIHDVNRTEGPAVDLERFKMLFGCKAIALIERVGFHDHGVRHRCLESLYHVTRQNVGTVLFARVQLDGHLAVDAFVDALVKVDQRLRVDFAREIHLGLCTRRIGRYFLTSHHRGLTHRFSRCHLLTFLCRRCRQRRSCSYGAGRNAFEQIASRQPVFVTTCVLSHFVASERKTPVSPLSDRINDFHCTKLANTRAKVSAFLLLEVTLKRINQALVLSLDLMLGTAHQNSVIEHILQQRFHLFPVFFEHLYFFRARDSTAVGFKPALGRSRGQFFLLMHLLTNILFPKHVRPGPSPVSTQAQAAARLKSNIRK